MDGLCKISEQESDPDFSMYPSIKATIENNGEQSSSHSFNFCYTTEKKVQELLLDINIGKSCSHNFISLRCLRESAQEIALTVVNIINNSINQCKYKIGQLTPLF